MAFISRVAVSFVVFLLSCVCADAFTSFWFSSPLLAMRGKDIHYKTSSSRAQSPLSIGRLSFLINRINKPKPPPMCVKYHCDYQHHCCQGKCIYVFRRRLCLLPPGHY